MSPYGFMVTLSPSGSKSRITVAWGRRYNGVATTTATIFAFPNAAGRGQPFLQLYLPFCMGKEPVSSIYCRPGALIVSCLRTGNDRRDVICLYQWHFNVCKYCFIKNQQKALNAQEDRGGEGRGNATIKRRLEGTWTGGGDR